MSMFSAHHYNFLAASLREINDATELATDRMVLVEATNALAQKLQIDNPNFDVKRFLLAIYETPPDTKARA